MQPFDKVLMPLVVALVPAGYWAAAAQRWVAGGPAPAVPLGAQLAAAAAFVAALALEVWAMLANRFFSSVVRLQPERGHAVCASGPYAAVRHPGYAGFLLQAAAEAALLQSWWCAAAAGARGAVIVARTAYEDAFLARALPGYAAYAARVRWRLAPGVW